MKKLLKEYKNTRSITRSKLNGVEKEIFKLDNKENLSTDECKKLMDLQEDKKIINSWISNLNYSIKWMEIGRQPNSMRGIERRSVYQNQILVDPSTLKDTIEENQDVFKVDDEQEEESLEYLESLTEERLDMLSKRDRDIYLMSINGMPANEIAEYMHMKYNTVYKIIERSRQKIIDKNESQNVISSLEW